MRNCRTQMPYGKSLDESLDLVDVLALLENKLTALTEHMKSIKAEHPNQDTYYQVTKDAQIPSSSAGPPTKKNGTSQLKICRFVKLDKANYLHFFFSHWRFYWFKLTRLKDGRCILNS